MKSVDTVVFLISIITCLVGVFTFVSGMLQRSKNDGVLANKVDMALKGIDEIKDSLNENTTWRREISTKVEGHEQNIKTLFSRCSEIQRDLNELWQTERGINGK